MLLSVLGVLLTGTATLVQSLPNTPFHTSGRWIMDNTKSRYKFRCINWPGHMEVGIPEGLSSQTPETIAKWIQRNGFNCVRMTYSIDMALAQDIPVSQSFQEASSLANDPSALMNVYNNAVKLNPWLASSTRIGAFATVIQALDQQGIAVVLDNHVSKAGWCCNSTDGNGWWDESSGYDASNSRYFNTTSWLNGLDAIASFTKNHNNIVGMSLRNELRADAGQDSITNHSNWYNFVTQGANIVHDTNPDLLVIIGGPVSATDLSFLRFNPLQGASTTWAQKTVFEWHQYYWSLPVAGSICWLFDQIVGARTGFILEQNQPFTAPLWLSEFGFEQVLSAPGNLLGEAEQKLEQAWIPCLVNYLENNDADWAIWVVAGSYYLRQGSVMPDESYGLLDSSWTDWRNSTVKNALGNIFQMTQGP